MSGADRSCHPVLLSHPADFDGWRDAARRLGVAGVPAARIEWRVEGDGGDLLAGAGAAESPLPAAPGGATPLHVPKRFIDLARALVCHRDPGRFDLLYRLLLGLQQDRRLLDNPAHPDVARAGELAKAIRRGCHKMHAFVRFREVGTPEGPRFVAWFEPEHFIVERTAGFFRDRFAAMNWAIFTPVRSASWDGRRLDFGPGGRPGDLPQGDSWEGAWKTYYASIFNPARVRVKAMTAEMPKKYWANMPEAALIPDLLKSAGERVDMMIDRNAALGDLLGSTDGEAESHGEERRRPRLSLGEAREAVQVCTRCPLYEPATQAVFGEGPANAPLMLVGEQPGNDEDLAGLPFVGPAGKLLDRALMQAGIERSATYVTNAVKHFRFEWRGKRRIHQSPEVGHIDACRWWLGQETAAVQPRLIVAMGGSAARALFRAPQRIGATRGRVRATPDGQSALITVHPSYLLRLPDKAMADAEFGRFVADLVVAREAIEARA